MTDLGLVNEKETWWSPTVAQTHGLRVSSQILEGLKLVHRVIEWFGVEGP